jgi:CRP/FNR family transcriptional activator FtrB
MQCDPELLRKVELFSGIEQPILAVFSSQIFVLDVPQRVVVLKQNQPADALHVIVTGKAMAFCEHGLRYAAMGLLGIGDGFWWGSLIEGGTASISVQTVQDSRLLIMPLPAVNHLIHSNIRFCENIMRQQASFTERQTRAMKGLKLRSATERLAAWLLENASKTNSQDRVDLPIEKQLLASELAMTPENLARALSTLTSHGIKLDGKRIWITNRVALQRFAAPTAGIEGMPPAFLESHNYENS